MSLAMPTVAEVGVLLEEGAMVTCREDVGDVGDVGERE